MTRGELSEWWSKHFCNCGMPSEACAFVRDVLDALYRVPKLPMRTAATH